MRTQLLMRKLTEDSYKRLKQEVEDAKAEADRAQGAYNQLILRLKEEFECKNLKQAKTLLKKLEQERRAAHKAFNKAMVDYQKRWK